MRRVRRALAGGGALVLACAWAPQWPAPEPGQPTLVVLVSIGGLVPAAYGADPTMPNLAALARDGVAADAVTPVAPASTYPAHATLLTGRSPATHGIVADRRIGERGVRAALFSHASLLRSETLWQRAGEARGGVVSLDWPSTVGAAIPLLLPDAQPKNASVTWLAALADTATPAMLEVVGRHGADAADTSVPGSARDAVLVASACELLGASVPPSLLLLRLSGTVPALLQQGPDSPQARTAFAAADAGLATLLGCLRGADRLGDTAMVVVGDHGYAPVHTAVAPNTLLARDDLIETDSIGVTRWRAIARSNGGSAFVYAAGERAAMRARVALDKGAARSGAYTVVSAQEMLRLGADPEAWFGLQAAPGFAFDDRATGSLLVAAAWRGMGGYLPPRVDMETGFVAWGRGLRRGIRVPQMQQTDVAPTLARLVGLPFDARGEGRVLVGVLDEGPPVALGAGDGR